jgi:Ser/Thr protein kinase RdoA (MazF antagonist)
MISQALRTLLEARYGLTGIASVRSLEGGERNLILYLEADPGAFVLRVTPPDGTAASVAYEHALLAHAAAALPEAPRPVAARDGTTLFLHAGRIHTLFPFLPGQMADRESDAVRAAAARLLARLHRVLLRFPDRSPRPGHASLRDLAWPAQPARGGRSDHGGPRLGRVRAGVAGAGIGPGDLGVL